VVANTVEPVQIELLLARAGFDGEKERVEPFHRRTGLLGFVFQPAPLLEEGRVVKAPVEKRQLQIFRPESKVDPQLGAAIRLPLRPLIYVFESRSRGGAEAELVTDH